MVLPNQSAHSCKFRSETEQLLPNQAESMAMVHKALNTFEIWRESPRTQCLLDWIENGLMLDNYMGGNPSLMTNLAKERSGVVPAP